MAICHLPVSADENLDNNIVILEILLYDCFNIIIVMYMLFCLNVPWTT